MILRRSFLKKCGQAFALLGLGAAIPKTEENKGEKEFFHQVFFWMKEPENKQLKATFEKNLSVFLKVCEKDKLFTRKYFVGTPANTPREVVDNTYAYSLVVVFKNKEFHDKYQEHPAHKKFIEDTKQLWTKVLIYDAIGIL